MTDYYCKNVGTGTKDGLSDANAWGVADISWSTVCSGSNTLYLVGTISAYLSMGANPGPGNTLTISGNSGGAQGVIDWADAAGTAFNAYQREGVILEDLEITKVSGNVLVFNNCKRITIRRCHFYDLDVAGDLRAIWIHTPTTGNLNADWEISNNTFDTVGAWDPTTNNGVGI